MFLKYPMVCNNVNLFYLEYFQVLKQELSQKLPIFTDYSISFRQMKNEKWLNIISFNRNIQKLQPMLYLLLFDYIFRTVFSHSCQNAIQIILLQQVKQSFCTGQFRQLLTSALLVVVKVFSTSIPVVSFCSASRSCLP